MRTESNVVPALLAPERPPNAPARRGSESAERTVLGQYLYCVIRCAEERTFDGVAPIGQAGGPVYTVPYDSLAAVVSDSPVTEYESTRANMLAHERVQERVMRELPLLPVRFGTVAGAASSSQQIWKLLAKRFQEFDGLLADMDGKVELGLKVLWRDEKLPFEEVLSRNEGIRRLRDSLAGKSPQATHFDRIRLGEMIKDALGRKRKAEAASLLGPLRRIARRTVENPIVVDRMIVNAAFLVEASREEELDRAVDRLEQGLQDRVIFKYVGPVPPYNFVNVIVNWQELE